MKKGFSEEILSFTLITFSIIIMTLFFTSEGLLKGGEVSRSVSGKIMDESANMAIHTLYDDRIEKINKTYIELIVDAHIQGNNDTKVYYGEGVGTIHVWEIINPLFNNYFGDGGWKLVVKTNQGTSIYGNLKKESKYKYISNIPIPAPSQKGSIGNVTLHV